MLGAGILKRYRVIMTAAEQNEMINKYMPTNNIIQGNQDDPEALCNCIPNNEDDVLTVMVKNEKTNTLLKAVESLSKRYRFVIMNYYYSGMSLIEIGKILNVSESRVCQMKTEGLRLLQKRLNRDELMCA